MRAEPQFPRYKTARPPKKTFWLAVGMGVMLITGSLMALSAAGPTPVLALTSGGLAGVMVAATGGLLHLLWYRASTHNAELHSHLVTRSQQQWWQQHQQSFGLQAGVLLGPAGRYPADWIRVLNRGIPPQQGNTQGENRLIVPLVSVPDIRVRESRLAELLVSEWYEQYQALPLTSPLSCYWQGTDSAWQAFREKMRALFPQVTLPFQPDPWQGEVSLAEISHQLTEARLGETVLIAGCCVADHPPGQKLPAGEAAVLWQAGPQGVVRLTRGETFSTQMGDSLPDVSARLLKQNTLTQPPDICALFTLAGLESLGEYGWDLRPHIQDVYWGEIGGMEALVALSLAAFGAEHFQQPCSWIARNPTTTFALGIVKPDGYSIQT